MFSCSTLELLTYYGFFMGCGLGVCMTLVGLLFIMLCAPPKE